jgi:transcriptional regulator with XRE-family HTH domain
MAKRKRARPGEGIPAQTKETEGRALHALWKKRHRRTQAEFAAACGFTQGYLQQFFGGLRPLTLDLAERFAEELDVEIAEFSPRLAQEFHDQLAGTEWPFRNFTRAEYQTLTHGQRLAVESMVLGNLIDNGTVKDRKFRRIG